MVNETVSVDVDPAAIGSSVVQTRSKKSSLQSHDAGLVSTSVTAPRRPLRCTVVGAVVGAVPTFETTMSYAPAPVIGNDSSWSSTLIERSTGLWIVKSRLSKSLVRLPSNSPSTSAKRLTWVSSKERPGTPVTETAASAPSPGTGPGCSQCTTWFSVLHDQSGSMLDPSRSMNPPGAVIVSVTVPSAASESVLLTVTGTENGCPKVAGDPGVP